ncbi:fungal hydrophobin [Sanghuangporus baumii]|uniref:Hydrophobin n=1 Tax=Sanghuangporus baumii TaxID=108892 RepID=A0A9Q5N8P5_SANBA|nr:fungal hydrophobin [Sanghuangporus baumii]
MFSKFPSLAFAVILAVATSVLSQCDTSTKAMCCSSVAPAGSTAIAPILSAIGVVIQDVNIPVGVGCSPITVIGTGSSGCDASPAQSQSDVFQLVSTSELIRNINEIWTILLWTVSK